MGDVVGFTGITTIDCSAEDALEKAKEWGMDSCVVAGFDKDNGFHFGGSTSDIARIVLILELAKKHILEQSEED